METFDTSREHDLQKSTMMLKMKSIVSSKELLVQNRLQTNIDSSGETHICDNIKVKCHDSIKDVRNDINLILKILNEI